VLKFPFVHEDQSGEVSVTIERVDDPAGIGQPPETRGFPACAARIDYPFRGYRSLFGWVQLVQSTDNSTGGSGFDIDPFGLFNDVPSPYCFFGFLPTLFDAPTRREREPINWVAHSFLAWTPLDERPRTVKPLLGFSWGFDIDRAGSITIRPVGELSAETWNSHVPYLRGSYPDWHIDQWQS
jgi:hypothetical protein